MKSWVKITAVLIASFIFAFVVSGLNPIRKTTEAYAPLDEFTKQLGMRIIELMGHYDIPGSSIALVKDYKIVWSHAYGYADIDNGRSLTKDTPMRVQSISKPVTASGVMKLVEQGILDLDAPVVQYLKSWHMPDSGFQLDQMTTRQLLSHTSGLPLGDVFTIYSPYESMPSLREKLTEEAILISEPGESFSYSNTGYNLLELLIEEVTGQEFADFMQREVLNPLGMNSSSFVWIDGYDHVIPVGYDLNGDPVPAYVYPEKASGGLFSTAEDIAAFTIAGMHGSDRFYTPVSGNIGIYDLVFDAYGLGYYLETLHNGKLAVSHGGQGTGIMTHFHAVPETGDAIVILTNSQRSWPFISYILSDWANWCGFSSVGMERIILGKYIIWAVIGLIWTAVILLVQHLIVGCFKYSKHLCIIQIGFGIAIMGILAWCSVQKYLFISSVFPIASLYLAISAFALAVTLIFAPLKNILFSRMHS